MDKKKTINILLVEDDKVQAGVTKDFLESHGFEITWAKNGTGAIKTVKTQPVDVILLDFILPDMNGNEVCRFLKQNDDTRFVPIIALTIKNSTEEKVAGLQAGADDYLPKPYSEEELIARIYAMLRSKELQDELRRKNVRLSEVLSKVKVLAMTDPMTGLFNRRHFDTVLEKEFNETVRYKHPTSCMVIDVDDFKSINDGHGHHVGDICLKEIADIINNSVRKIDIVARWGGEEFIVSLPETRKEAALNVASRVLTAVSNNKFSTLPRQITVSIGIAGVPDASIDNVEKLVNAADNAMYEAKAKGGNRIEVAGYIENSLLDSSAQGRTK